MSGPCISVILTARSALPTAKGPLKKPRWPPPWASILSVCLGETIANGEFVHYPDEKWFPLTEDDSLPDGILDQYLRDYYDPENDLQGSQLIDLQSSNEERGICALPFTRQSDGKTVYIPMNIVANLYVSNGMSAGNTRNEARVQGLSEVFERYVKNWRVIRRSLSQSAPWKAKVSRSSVLMPLSAVSIRLSVWCCLTRPTVPVLPLSALILISVLHWSGLSLSCYRDAA